jgi:hypothetical protein
MEMLSLKSEVMKLKNELKKAETTIKQLRDSETGHSAKAAG